MPKDLFLIKKNIKKTGTKSDITIFIIKVFSIKTPITFTAINKINAKRNTVLKVILNQFFTIFR